MAKVLLLEDDLILQEIIEEYLQESGFEVESFFDGEQALDAIASSRYDMLLLDVNVPSIDGFELLGYLREIKNSTPAIFITSLAGVKSLQKGFDLGANDYLKKPFDLEELIIRIEHHLQASSEDKRVSFGKMELYPKALYLQRDGKRVELKRREVEILLYLINRKNEIISVDELLENVWSSDKVPTYATIRTYIKNLRRAIGDESIENIKGSGYRLNTV
jgi:two-component system OmpR family response regulator